MDNTLLWYTARGAGAVSLVLLSAVVVLGVMTYNRVESDGWPRFLTTGLHRNVSLIAVFFLGLHIVTAVIDSYTHLGWTAAIIPFSSYYRTIWLGLGAVAMELVVAIVLTSLFRRFIGVRAWRAVHWLAYASWPIAVLHGLGTGTDNWSIWMLGINGACTFAVAAAVTARLSSRSTNALAKARAGK